MPHSFDSTVPIGPGSQRWREDDGTVTLDALGNWRRSWTELDGNAAFDDATERDDRTHDLINRTVGRTLRGQGSGGGGADLNLGGLQYDLASNLSLWKRQAGTSAATVEAVHDAWNRLVDVTVGGNLRSHESHNALHWRTYRFGDVRSALGATPDLSPDGTLDQARLFHYGQDWRLLEERVDDGFDLDGWKAGTFAPGDLDRTQQYVWGLRYVDDIVLHRIDANNDGDYADTGDSTWYHLTDAQFSTVCIVRPNGAVAERVSYNAYGNARHHWAGDVNGDGAVIITGGGASDDLAIVTAIAADTLANRTIGGSAYRAEADLDRSGVIDGTDATAVGGAKAALPAGQLSPVLASGPDNPVGWDGYLYSPECALYEVRFRVYEPVLGRWIERDPAGYVSWPSLYQAFSDAPINHLDPAGLQEGADVRERMAMRARVQKHLADKHAAMASRTCCAPINLLVVDYGYYRDRFNEEMIELNPDAIRAASVDHMIAGIRSAIAKCRREERAKGAKNPCCCVESLFIAGHGAPGDFSVGSGIGGPKHSDGTPSSNQPPAGWDSSGSELTWKSPTQHTMQKLGQLEDLMCRGASITFGGCHVGGGEVGIGFTQEAANQTGVTCTAYTVYTYPGRGRTVFDPDKQPGPGQGIVTRAPTGTTNKDNPCACK